ncbi:hypothetical protein HMPREF9630_00227 [Peptoanaerobacter stomatis]|uniref:ParB-like N-terminal domain-containing protein n=1 Tax=Peptoanaerobacter stomatis TaxID=796937 RepID=V9HSJ6_9FIRM|nr:ParB/RepB/Spo0J family partition protein [Peptoanaerobacter stomatis]EHL18502.1 hypothetical protein HMPREF9630_00227 [Peptoanaerobacter stomatis]
MSAFNLTDLLNSRIKEDIQKQDSETEFKYIDIKDLIESKENFYKTNKLEDMKESIRILGIEQPLRVEEADAQGKYKILAGHTRYKASVELSKEDSKYSKIPCYIKKKQSDLLSELTLILTNYTAREPSEYEKMQEILRIEELIKEYKKNNNIKGNTRDILSNVINMSNSNIARYKAINNNLDVKLLEEYKNEKISTNLAYEISILDKDNQEKLYHDIQENKNITIQDIKKVREKAEHKEKNKSIKENKSVNILQDIINEAKNNINIILENNINIDITNIQELINKQLDYMYNRISKKEFME